MSENKTWFVSGQKKGMPCPRSVAALATRTSDRVFRRKWEARAPNTACCLLIDGSESMCMRGERPSLEHPIRKMSKMENAKHAAVAFARVLAMSKFSTWACVFQNNRHNVESTAPVIIHTVKDWDQSYVSALPQLRMLGERGGLPPDGSTPMSPALEYCRKKLMTRHEPRKVMMVFTDGEADSRTEAAKQCELMDQCGIELVVIGIELTKRRKTSFASYLKGLHHTCTMASADDDLTKVTMEQLEKILEPSRHLVTRAM